jgi:tetratricopeptide (TPR) repeat protein
MRAFLFLATLVLAPSAPAIAQSQTALVGACADAPRAAARLKACNQLLQSGDLGPDVRAMSLARRGLALVDSQFDDDDARRKASRQATIDAGDAVQLAPSAPLGHVLRGLLAERRGDSKLARSDYDTAARLDPIFETFLARGRLLRRLGEQDAAMADLDRAIALGPRFASGYVARGLIWYARGDHARALQDFTKAAEVEPAATAPRYNQGLALQAMGRTEEALSLYDRMLAATPPDPASYGARAQARYAQGDLQGALADRRAFVRAAPRNADAWVDLGSLLIETGEYREGLSAYARADKLSSLNPHLYNERCWWRAAVGRDLEAALADCETALRLVPDSLSYLDSRGFARFRSGNLNGALADFDAVLRASQDKVGSRFMRGATLRALGRRQEGDADISAAVAKKPDIASEYEKYGVRL